MPTLPEPPEMFKKFVSRYPKLDQAWRLTKEASSEGPLDQKTLLLVKLGVAAGALRQGAVHAAVRKAVAGGVSRQEIEQVVALTASTLGFPSSVAVFSWIQDELQDR